METQKYLFREIKETVLLAGPVTVAFVAQNSMSFVDTMMVGRLGGVALAGVALAHAIYFFVFVLAMGTVLAVSPLASQAFGAGDQKQVGKSAAAGIQMAGLLMVPAVILLWHVEPVMVFFGQDPAVIEAAMSYLRVELIGFLPNLAIIGLRCYIEAVTRPWAVTMASITGFLLNIVGNYALIYGNLGAPRLGVVGSAISTVTVHWAVLAILVFYTASQPRFHPYRLYHQLLKPHLKTLRELIRVGRPIGIAHGIEVGMFTMTALLIGKMGAAALTAHQIALQSASFSFTIPLSIAVATSVRVGHAVGREDPPGVRSAGYLGILLGAVIMAVFAVIFWVIPERVVGLFLSVNDPANTAVVRMAGQLLGIAAVFQLFDGIQVSAGGALRGLKDTRIIMWIVFVAYWVIGLGIGYVLAFYAGMGAHGMWWGLVLGLMTAAVLLVIRFRWQTDRMRGPLVS